jgi:hypothetical protein
VSKLIVFGDIDLSSVGMPTLKYFETISNIYTEYINSFLCLGDIGYNLRDNDYQVGENFMKYMSRIWSKIPLSVKFIFYFKN